MDSIENTPQKMNPERTPLRRLGAAWLDFWFITPPAANLAAMRIGVGLVIVYVLLARSHDLEALLGAGLFGDSAGGQVLDAMAWRFSFYDWVAGRGWLWTVHVASITFAVGFLLGIYPSITGTLTLLCHLSYGHRNPAVWLGLDGLLTLALVYLILLPTAQTFAIPGTQLNRPPQKPNRGARPRSDEPERIPWCGVALRALQIHLCLLYFQSGLAKLNGTWLGGMALWHPRLVEKGTPIGSETLQTAPYLLVVIPAALVLFELFYSVFIWLRGFRHITIACAVVLHLAVGVLWEKLPFNLLMIVLNLAFFNPRPLELLFQNLTELGNYAWRSALNRT
jgi:hypothetical protein